MRGILWVIGVASAGALALAACSSLENLATPPSSSPEDGGGDATGASVDGETPRCAAALESDGKNCGRCGHDCLGGACTSGACQPVQLIDERQNLFGILVDATHVYYLEDGMQVVARIPKAGGPAETVCSKVQGIPQPFALDDVNVYCATSFGMARVAKADVTSTFQIFQGPASFGALFVDRTSIYAIGNPSLEVLKSSGATRTVPITMQSSTSVTAAADDTRVFSNHQGNGVFAWAKDTSDAGLTLLLDVPEPSGIALDAQYAYVSVRATGTVKRIAKTGGAALNIVTSVNAPEAIAVDDTDVFFATGDGSILSCPKAGCTAAPRVLAEKQGEPKGIAVDGTAVYWTRRSSGTVMRVAK